METTNTTDTTTRKPAEVQAEIAALHATSRSAFVPLSVQRAIELQTEFNEAVVADLAAIHARIEGAELLAADKALG